jgi:amyloid beta precursor protein binding protein 1
MKDIQFRPLIILAKKLWELDIPLIVCKTIGFVGYIRVQVKEHTIIEMHPDNEIPDLRLNKPFESLKSYFDAINLNNLNLKDHSHTPYVIILYKYLEQWLLNYQDIPKTKIEKEKFKQMIIGGIRKDENGIPIDEENFKEAIKAVNTCISHTNVSNSSKEVLNDNSCINLNSKVII